MVDQLSSGLICGDCHLYPTRRQSCYIQRYSAHLGAAATWKVRGAESGEEGIDNNEGYRFCHYDTTARGGLSADIDREITVGHVINNDREGFDCCSACPFIALFSSVFRTPELGRRLKSNILGKGHYVLCVDILLHLQAVLRVSDKKITVDVG